MRKVKSTPRQVSYSSNPALNRLVHHLGPGGQSYFSDSNRHVLRDIDLGGFKAPPVITATPRRMIAKPVNYLRMSDSFVFTEHTLAQFLALQLHTVYSVTNIGHGKSGSYVQVIEPYISILFGFANTTGFVGCGIPSSLVKYGYELVGMEMTAQELAHKFASIKNSFLSLTKLPRFEGNEKIVIAMALSLLPLMITELFANSLEPWFNARWRALGKQTDCTIPSINLIKPTLDNCLAITRFFAYKDTFRASVFQLLQSLAHSEGVYKHVFLAMIRSLYYAGMSHIGMIYEFVFKKDPTVLDTVELGFAEKDALVDLHAFMLAHPAADRPFLKILYPDDMLEPLSIKRHKIIHALARSIAGINSHSVRNIW